MKSLLTACCLALALLSSSAMAKELKIGVIDFARVMEESPQAEKARQSIMDEFSPREQELRDLGESIRKMEERFTRDGAVMSSSEREKLERDIIAEKREFKRKQDQFREDVNFKQNELVGSLQRKLITSIRTYAKDKGFDILLAEGVIYTTDALNVTEEILAQLRKDANKP